MALFPAVIASIVAASFITVQAADKPAPAQDGAACPPDVAGEAPTVGSGNSTPLSDKLARSRGIICPPAGVDPSMPVPPPAGGNLKVLPPPGSPGGDPRAQPK